jgi:hypothetical protein
MLERFLQTLQLLIRTLKVVCLSGKFCSPTPMLPWQKRLT